MGGAPWAKCKGTTIEFDVTNNKPRTVVSNLPLPPGQLICVEYTIGELHGGDVCCGVSFNPTVDDAWVGNFNGTCGLHSQGEVKQGKTGGWMRSKAGSVKRGDVITMLMD